VRHSMRRKIGEQRGSLLSVVDRARNMIGVHLDDLVQLRELLDGAATPDLNRMQRSLARIKEDVFALDKEVGAAIARK